MFPVFRNNAHIQSACTVLIRSTSSFSFVESVGTDMNVDLGPDFDPSLLTLSKFTDICDDGLDPVVSQVVLVRGHFFLAFGEDIEKLGISLFLHLG